MWWQAPFQFTACALYKENSTRIWNTLKNPDLIEESGNGSTAYILLPDSSCSFHLWLHWQNCHLLLLDDDHWKAKRIQARNPAKWKIQIWSCLMQALNLMLSYASSESDPTTCKLWIWCCHMKALNLICKNGHFMIPLLAEWYRMWGASCSDHLQTIPYTWLLPEDLD